MHDEQAQNDRLRVLIRVGYVLLSIMIVESLINILRGDVVNTFLAMSGVFIAHYALRYNQERLERETEGSLRSDAGTD